MNIVYEAERTDGTRQLLPSSLIRDYIREARDVSGRSKDKAFFNFGRMLANLMMVRGYVSIVCIEYNCDGQRRTQLMRRRDYGRNDNV